MYDVMFDPAPQKVAMRRHWCVALSSEGLAKSFNRVEGNCRDAQTKRDHVPEHSALHGQLAGPGQKPL
jgi:hypothetical protein